MVEPSVDQEQQLTDIAVNVTKEDDQLKEHEVSIGKRKRGRRPRKLLKSLEVRQENVDKKLTENSEVSQQSEGNKLDKSPKISRLNGSVAPADMAMEVVFPVVVGLKAAELHGSVCNKEKPGVDKMILNGSADPKNKLRWKIKVHHMEKVKLQSRNVQASVEHHEKALSERELRRSTRININLQIKEEIRELRKRDDEFLCMFNEVQNDSKDRLKEIEGSQFFLSVVELHLQPCLAE